MDLNYFSQFNNTDIYLPFFILLVLLNLGLIIFIIFHLHYGHKKHKELKKSIRETEIMISRGFTVLHHDIAEQLKSLHKKKSAGLLPPLEQEKEMELLRDLESIQKHIWREIKEIGKNSW